MSQNNVIPSMMLVPHARDKPHTCTTEDPIRHAPGAATKISRAMSLSCISMCGEVGGEGGECRDICDHMAVIGMPEGGERDSYGGKI